MDWIKEKNRRTGVMVTVAAHLLLVLLLSFLVMQPPFPPPTQIGVEVNLGNSNDGMSDIQPETPSQQANATSQPNSEKIATQSTEESVNLKNKTSSEKVTPKETPEKVIDNRFTFQQNKKSGGNEGQTGKPGDQGKEDGDKNATNYTGGGGSNGSPGFELSGRKKVTLDRPKQVLDQEGKVVIKIWVNKYGKVVDAKQEINRSTTTNSVLVNLAIKSALISVFDANPNAPEVQTGYITYIFTL